MALGLRRTWRSLKKRVNRSSVKRTALQEQAAGQQKVPLEQQARIADLEDRFPAQQQARIADLEDWLKTAETEGAVRAALQEQVAGQQKVILDQQARIADLEGRLKTAETEGEKAQQKISELEFRIELSCAELIRSKGQIDFVRDLMLQQIRL
jgi:chromosome segregation ATPase